MVGPRCMPMVVGRAHAPLSEDEAGEGVTECLRPTGEAEQDEESEGDKRHDEPPDILAGRHLPLSTRHWASSSLAYC